MTNASGTYLRERSEAVWPRLRDEPRNMPVKTAELPQLVDGLDARSAAAQQLYLEGHAKDASWWGALDDQLELLSRAAMRSGVEAL